jgi:hypothetical protein
VCHDTILQLLPSMVTQLVSLSTVTLHNVVTKLQKEAAHLVFE